VRPITPGPSKADCDALIALPKYLLRIPRKRYRDGQWRMRADTIYDSARNRVALTVEAHARDQRGQTPNVALVWRSRPIRRIDWKVRKRFADRSVVEGWHEHLWDDELEDRVGRAFEPPALDCSLEALFIRACQLWNITILSRRDQSLREARSHE
jgi:hypothetical protein